MNGVLEYEISLIDLAINVIYSLISDNRFKALSKRKFNTITVLKSRQL